MEGLGVPYDQSSMCVKLTSTRHFHRHCCPWLGDTTKIELVALHANLNEDYANTSEDLMMHWHIDIGNLQFDAIRDLGLRDD